MRTRSSAAALVLAILFLGVSGLSAEPPKPGRAEGDPAYTANIPLLGKACVLPRAGDAGPVSFHGSPFRHFAGRGMYGSVFFGGAASLGSYRWRADSRFGSGGVGGSWSGPGAAFGGGSAFGKEAFSDGLALGPDGSVLQQTPSHAPEPATMLLLATGMGSLLVARRRARPRR
jgi:hypothetical protein